jgi:flagella synthesis protein FlgN
MNDLTPIHSLLSTQQQQLQLLLSLLHAELSAISARDVEQLEQGCAAKLELLEQIQQTDQAIACLPQLAELKNQDWFRQSVVELDTMLNECKLQNEVNRVTLEQSQLVIQRFKHELLQNRGKSGLTYTAKGKPAVDHMGKGFKA